MMEQIFSAVEDIRGIVVASNNRHEKSMSEASLGFARSLLGSLKIKYFDRGINTESGGSKMNKYVWKEGETEDVGLQGCMEILKEEMLPFDVEGDSIGLYDVRNFDLPELNAGNHKSRGRSDLAVGPEKSMTRYLENFRDGVLLQTVALVELKTGKAELKLGQLLLQLVSLSKISRQSQGVVTLGTDCAAKWLLLHFSAYNEIDVQSYEHGEKCITDFKNHILGGTEKRDKNVAPPKLSSVQEEDGDQNFELGEFGVAETPRDQAIAREVYLTKLASELESLFGEKLEVPSWAKASATCPSYYMGSEI
jgi:hypothetical protein